MRRIAVVFCVLWTLGCAGIAESALKAGGVEVDADGNVTMTLPDGSVVRTQEGGALPEDFPIPPPEDGATPINVVEIAPADGGEQTVVSFQMTRPKNELTATYTAWFDANVPGYTVVSESQAGVSTQIFKGKHQGYDVTVTLSEAFGSNTVSLMKGTSPAKQEASD